MSKNHKTTLELALLHILCCGALLLILMLGGVGVLSGRAWVLVVSGLAIILVLWFVLRTAFPKTVKKGGVSNARKLQL